MTDPQATFRSAVWNHAGKILEYILMYFTSVLVARGLGVQENGTFVGLFSVSQLLLVLTSFGLEVSLNKHIPQLTGELRRGYIRYLLQRVLAVRALVIIGVAGVLYGVMHFFAKLFPPLFSEFIWLLVAYTGVRSIVSLFAIVLTAELQTRATSLINVLTRALEVALIGLMAAGEMTTMNAFVVFLFTSTLQMAAYLVAARTRLFGKTVRLAVLPIVMFGGIYWTNTVVEYFLGRQGDVLFLTMLLPDSTQASLYDVAFAISQLASLSLTIGLGGITLATYARLALRETELLERFYDFMIRVKSLLSIPLYAFILFNAESVLFVLYSSRYLAAARIIQGIAAFRIVSRLFGGPENAEYLLSKSQVSRLVAIGLVAAVVNVGLDVLLIPGLAAVGAVVASGFGNLVANALGAWAVYSNSSVRMQWKFWLKVSMGTCVASLVCAMLIPPQSLALIAGQASVYILLTIALFIFVKPLTPGDREWLLRIDSRLALPLRYFVRQDQRISEIRVI
jgi:O-antigen/teichoic acid export membrane protein